MKPENQIWIFMDENGDLLGFNSFEEAHKYAFEIYDKNLKFFGKTNKTYCYINSWNSEEVYIRKLRFHNQRENKK